MKVPKKQIEQLEKQIQEIEHDVNTQKELRKKAVEVIVKIDKSLADLEPLLKLSRETMEMVKNQQQTSK